MRQLRSQRALFILMTIKNIFCVLLWGGISLCASAQNRNIHLEKPGWEKVMDKAKAENKMVFVDCNAVWCAPCKKLVKEVFSVDSIADFFNEHFVSVSYDIEKDPKPTFKGMPDIAFVPLLIFVDPKTNEVKHVSGGPDAPGLMKMGKDVLRGTGTLADMEARYNAGERSEELIIRFLDLLKDNRMNEKYSAVLHAYFSEMAPENMLVEHNWRLIETNILSPFDTGFQKAWQERRALREKYGTERINKTFNLLWDFAVTNQLRWEKVDVNRVDNTALDKFVALLKNSGWEHAEEALAGLALDRDMRYARYDKVVAGIKAWSKSKEVTSRQAEYTLNLCDKLIYNAPKKSTAKVITPVEIMAYKQVPDLKSRLLYKKSELLKAIGKVEAAKEAEIVATKVLNAHFYDR